MAMPPNRITSRVEYSRIYRAAPSTSEIAAAAKRSIRAAIDELETLRKTLRDAQQTA